MLNKLHLLMKLKANYVFPFIHRSMSSFIYVYFRKPIPSTVKAGDLEKIISRCQVCMKRRH